MITIDIVGLRSLKGRFASMLDRGLVEIQLEEAARTAQTVAEIYRARAPRGPKVSTETGSHFADGITGVAVATEAGFSISVETDNPKLRGWLKTGTGVYAGHGRIIPQHSRALGPIRSWAPGSGSGPYYFASIAGMPAQHWEDAAQAEAVPLASTMGRSIGQRVVVSLAGL